MHPRLLVLDEPTSALDPTAAEDVLATLTRLVHDLGVSVLLAEHRLERVVPFADRMACSPAPAAVTSARPGRAACPGARGAAAHRARPSRGVVAIALECARRSASGPRTLVPPPDDAPARAGGHSRRRGSAWCTARPSPCARSTSTLAGRVTALMGRNGSGKSTLLWSLQGSRSRRAGTVRIGERPGRPRRRRTSPAGRAAAADSGRPALPRDRGRGVPGWWPGHTRAPRPNGAGHRR